MQNLSVIRKKIPLEWFACPLHKDALVLNGNTLHSKSQKYYKNKSFDFWDFIPNICEIIENPEWKIWKELQKNGEVSYEQDPLNNLGVGFRDDFIEFMNFCDFSGLILDIGCGPQSLPSHVEFCKNKNTFFVGIDPLIGEQPRQFSFVRGLGEYLPFKQNLFDQVLFVTSLDHFIEPQLALIEAKRVLEENGEICIWIGEKDKNIPKPNRINLWYENLPTPEGAEDKFHFKRLDSILLEDYFNELSLNIVSKHISVVNEFKRNLFYKIKK